MPENTTFFSDPGLPEDTTFYYRVIASNGEGDSDFSNKAEGATLYTYWARSFGDLGAESAGAVIQTSDQGFLAAGSTTSFGGP